MFIEAMKNGLYKTKMDKIVGDFEIGDTIWDRIYNDTEKRYIRVPAYKVVKIRETKQNYILTLEAI